MKEFVRRINGCVIPDNLKGRVLLKNVAYGVKVDDAYFYFDFPYNENADALNEDLKNAANIQGIDVRLHQAFFASQRKGINGYVGYAYRFDARERSFFTAPPLTNLELSDEDKLAYLPIVHSAIHTDANYLAPVSPANDNDALTQVLVLCRWPHALPGLAAEDEETVYRPDKDNILITTFEIVQKIPISQSLVDELHGDVLYFVDSYFTSPVVEKIMAERRKSEVLAYHHSIDNLELDTDINMLDDLAYGRPVEDELERLRSFSVNLRVLRLMHYLLFQMEYVHAGQPGINSQRLFPLAGKPVSAIVDELVRSYNSFDQIRYQVNITGDISAVDRVPTAGDIKNLNPELYDVILILWNLMRNAAVVAMGRDATEVEIELAAENGRLKIAITNEGKILPQYFEFINDQRTEYPTRDDNPNKKYRGLEIVKDKCKSHNRRWKFQAAVNERAKIWYTTISLTL